MSTILKKELADKLVFKHQPKTFQFETTKVAKDFVNLQNTEDTGFHIAEVVAEQSGIEALRKQNLEAQIEETVLQRLKEIEEQAYKKAFDLGLIEGAEKAFKETTDRLSEHMVRLDELYKMIDHLKVEMVKANEAEIMRFILILSQKIAQREIQIAQEPILEMILQITADVQSAESVHVSLNPSDFQFIEELKKRNIKSADSLKRVKFDEDASVTPGGCIVETNFGSIDNTLEQRIEKAWALISSKLPTLSRVKA